MTQAYHEFESLSIELLSDLAVVDTRGEMGSEESLLLRAITRNFREGLRRYLIARWGECEKEINRVHFEEKI